MVVQAGNRPQLGAICQPDPAHDVHLPQLHRPGPLPTLVIRPPLLPLLRIHQAVANQRPIDRRPRRNPIHPLPLQVIANRPWTPTRMSTPHLHHPSLDLHRHLMRTRLRLRRPVNQTSQPLGRIPAQPHMHRLPGYPITASHISHQRPPKDLQHRLIPLLHNTQLHQHDRTLLRRRHTAAVIEEGVEPEAENQPVSGTYRNHCRPGTGAASTNCRPPTGATVTIMNRSRTELR